MEKFQADSKTDRQTALELKFGHLMCSHVFATFDSNLGGQQTGGNIYM